MEVIGESDNVVPLTAVELEQAEQLCIKTVQKELHERVENKEFNMLSPFTDDKGIIRVGEWIKLS